MKRSKGWHREDIKGELRKRGSSLAEISTGAGLARRSGSQSLITPGPTANRAIAAFLGVPLHELWPDWYDQYGNRITSKPRQTRNSSRRKSQKADSTQAPSIPKNQGENQ